MLKLKNAWKNEYVKSLIFLAIILGAIVVFWFGLRFYYRTDYPFLAVASESMIPTLYKGDLIVVQGGFNVSDINAEYNTGDIVVFRRSSDPEDLIVHRAVEKHLDGDSWYLKTKGDNNNGPDPWRIYDEQLVGKVVGSVPYIGHIPLFVHTPTGITIILILIVILILLEFIIPVAREKKKETEEPEEEPKEQTDVLDIGSL